MQKNRNRRAAPAFTDQGPEPYTVNIERAVLLNSNFRTALWTGEHLQATLMSIPEQIGLEAHPTLDQFLKIVDGTGLVLMGAQPDQLTFRRQVRRGDAIFVPSGTYHTLVTRGGRPLRFYARKGVILTTGGFGANVEMRMQYDTHWNKLDASSPDGQLPGNHRGRAADGGSDWRESGGNGIHSALSGQQSGHRQLLFS